MKVESDGDATSSTPTVRIDTPGEANYYRNGGIMQYVLRNLLQGLSEKLPRATPPKRTGTTCCPV